MIGRIALVIASVMMLGAGWAGPSGASPLALSLLGVWRTFDDHTGRERGAVRIYERDGLLFGDIVGTVDPAEARMTCRDCDGDRKNKPILGLTIIRGLRPAGDAWTGGEILDPQNGRTYRCTVRLSPDGQHLMLRGYLGISLFGRTQTWIRAAGPG